MTSVGFMREAPGFPEGTCRTDRVRLLRKCRIDTWKNAFPDPMVKILETFMS